MRAAVEKIRHICEQLAAAKGQPDYASTYQKLAKEAEALMENDEGRSDFMEVIYRYRPDQVSWELKREQQERERNVPAAEPRNQYRQPCKRAQLHASQKL